MTHPTRHPSTPSFLFLEKSSSDSSKTTKLLILNAY
jgi:hypothetical protein